MYLTSEVYSRLNQAFFENGLSISVKPDHIVVESSEEQVEERISKIIESVGFCPLISKNKIDNKVVFTISPHRWVLAIKNIQLADVHCYSTSMKTLGK